MQKEFICISSLTIQVVAIRLNDSHLLDEISDQRCIVRAISCPNLSPFDSQDYSCCSDDPTEATRGNLQAGSKVNDCSMHTNTHTHT